MEQHEFFHQLNQLTRFFSKELNERLTPLGIYSGQWTILYRLKIAGSCTQADLANYLGVEAPTITRTLKRLEASGLISREQGKDKREKVVALTEKALVSFGDWQKAVMEFENEILSAISNSQKETVSQFTKIIMKKLIN